MTMEDHLRRLIGDQMVRIAQLLAEIDALKAQLPSEPPPEPTP